MRKFALAAVILARLGLPANATELLPGPDVFAAKPSALRFCPGIAAKRPLRPLLVETAVRSDRKIAAVPSVQVTVRPQPMERIALVLGVAY
jgi:hypothetical protein